MVACLPAAVPSENARLRFSLPLPEPDCDPNLLRRTERDGRLTGRAGRLEAGT